MDGKTYMVIIFGNDDMIVRFFDAFHHAEEFRENARGMGYRSQMYNWDPADEAYRVMFK